MEHCIEMITLKILISPQSTLWNWLVLSWGFESPFPYGKKGNSLMVKRSTKISDPNVN